jgi:hypothetical protein
MSDQEINRLAWNEFRRATHQTGKVNWNYYICRGCNRYGDAHMVSLQARLELCAVCYGELPKDWRVKRGEQL